MKYVILFIIIILLLPIFFKYNNIQSYSNTDYIVPSVEIKMSEKIGGRGVFACKDYNIGDIIEICPCIIDDSSKFQGAIKDYVFTYDISHSLVAFGTCSIYNHSDNYNALWSVLSKDQMKFYATKNIKNGEEIFTSYGNAYWESRNALKKINI